MEDGMKKNDSWKDETVCPVCFKSVRKLKKIPKHGVYSACAGSGRVGMKEKMPWWVNRRSISIPSFRIMGLDYFKMGFIIPNQDYDCAREALWAIREGLA